MRKCCLLLLISSTFFCGNTESVVTDKDRAAGASDTSPISRRLGDTPPDPSRLLRARGLAGRGITASAVPLNVESNGRTVHYSPDMKGESNEERSIISTLIGGLERLSKSLEGVTTESYFFLNQQLRRWYNQGIHPDEAARQIGLGEKNISPKKLELWMEYVRVYAKHHSHYDLDQAYEKLKEGRSDDEVFERLASLEYVRDEELEPQIAWMYNKLAEELKSKLGEGASNWMAKKWKALNLPPKDVAETLGIYEGDADYFLRDSIVQWLGYNELLLKEQSELALSAEEAWRWLVGDMNKEEVMRFVRHIWLGLPDKTPARRLLSQA